MSCIHIGKLKPIVKVVVPMQTLKVSLHKAKEVPVISVRIYTRLHE